MLASDAEHLRGLSPGETVLGRYRIDSEVGSGGMGVVYAAKHLVTGREVALKCIQGTDPVRRERALREARSLGKVRHPRVVEIVDAGEENGWLFVVMEMLRGRTLRQYAGGERLSVDESVRITSMALEGIGAAHACGILHRDLKLSNIFCCLAPSTGEIIDVKLLDFGIARSLTGEEATITGSRDLIGSPNYMAPEQLLGDALSERTDLYAIGVVLYTLLSGRVPFQAGTAVSIGMQIVQGGAPLLSEVRPDVSKELAEVVRRAMAGNPTERFASAEEFSLALAQATTPGSFEATQTHPDSRSLHEAELGREATDESWLLNPFSISVLCTVGILLAGLVWILSQGP